MNVELAVAGRVLRDEDELGDALRLEPLRFPHQRVDAARPLEPPHLWDRAERAGVVAPLGDLEVRVAAASGQDARRQVVVEPGGEGLGREPRERREAEGGRRGLLELVEAEEVVHLRDLGRELGPVLLDHAPRDDDPVDLPRLLPADLLEDGVHRLLLRLVDEPAGVDDDDPGGVGVAERQPLAPEVAEHHLGVDEVLRAAERDDSYGRELHGHVRIPRAAWADRGPNP